jgi:hypothetical protein
MHTQSRALVSTLHPGHRPQKTPTRLVGTAFQPRRSGVLAVWRVPLAVPS